MYREKQPSLYAARGYKNWGFEQLGPNAVGTSIVKNNIFHWLLKIWMAAFPPPASRKSV